MPYAARAPATTATTLFSHGTTIPPPALRAGLRSRATTHRRQRDDTTAPAEAGRRTYAADRLPGLAPGHGAGEVRGTVRGGRPPAGAALLAADDHGGGGQLPVLGGARLVRAPLPRHAHLGTLDGGGPGRRDAGGRDPAGHAGGGVRGAVRALAGDRRRARPGHGGEGRAAGGRTGEPALDRGAHDRGDRPAQRPPRRHARTARRRDRGVSRTGAAAGTRAAAPDGHCVSVIFAAGCRARPTARCTSPTAPDGQCASAASSAGCRVRPTARCSSPTAGTRNRLTVPRAARIDTCEPMYPIGSPPASCPAASACPAIENTVARVAGSVCDTRQVENSGPAAARSMSTARYAVAASQKSPASANTAIATAAPAWKATSVRPAAPGRRASARCRTAWVSPIEPSIAATLSTPNHTSGVATGGNRRSARKCACPSRSRPSLVMPVSAVAPSSSTRAGRPRTAREPAATCARIARIAGSVARSPAAAGRKLRSGITGSRPAPSNSHRPPPTSNGRFSRTPASATLAPTPSTAATRPTCEPRVNAAPARASPISSATLASSAPSMQVAPMPQTTLATSTARYAGTRPSTRTPAPFFRDTVTTESRRLYRSAMIPVGTWATRQVTSSTVPTMISSNGPRPTVRIW